ncbi:MAG TPA: hypothetical protein VMX12_03170 [Acidimicrobiia bacterium]|nr:hypothetical protein [Acidimicrobiia bacterium]
MTDFYKLAETPFDKVVDKAIAAENARYLNDPAEQALAVSQAEAFGWQAVLRWFGLGPQLDAERDRLLAAFRQTPT